MTEEKGKVPSGNNNFGGGLNFLTSKIRTGVLLKSTSEIVSKSPSLKVDEETKVDVITKSPSNPPPLPPSSSLLPPPTNGLTIRYKLFALRQMGIKIISKGNLQPSTLLKEYMINFQPRLTKRRPIMPELHINNTLRQSVTRNKDYIKTNQLNNTDNGGDEKASISSNKSLDNKMENNNSNNKNIKQTNNSSDQHPSNKDNILKGYGNNNNNNNSCGGGRLTEDEKRKLFEQERLDLLEMRNKKKTEAAALEANKSSLLGYGNTVVGSYHDESDQIMEMFKAESGQLTQETESELKLAPKSIPQSNNDSLETSWFNDFLKTPLNVSSFEFGNVNKTLDAGFDGIVSPDGLGLGLGLGSSKSVKQSRLQTLFNDTAQDSSSINNSILSPITNNNETFIIPNILFVGNEDNNNFIANNPEKTFNDNSNGLQHLGTEVSAQMKGTTKMSVSSLFSAATKNPSDSLGLNENSNISSRFNFNSSINDLSQHNPQSFDVIKSVDVLSKLGVSPATNGPKSPTPFDNNNEEVFLPNSNTTPVKSNSPNPSSQFAFHDGSSNSNTSSAKKKPVMSAAARQSLMKKSTTVQSIPSTNTTSLPNPKSPTNNKQNSQLPPKPHANKPSPNINCNGISLHKPNPNQNKGISLHKPKSNPSPIDTTNNDNSPSSPSIVAANSLGKKIDFQALVANQKQVI
jgi:hypothetical protein